MSSTCVRYDTSQKAISGPVWLCKAISGQVGAFCFRLANRATFILLYPPPSFSEQGIWFNEPNIFYLLVSRNFPVKPGKFQRFYLDHFKVCIATMARDDLTFCKHGRRSDSLLTIAAGYRRHVLFLHRLTSFFQTINGAGARMALPVSAEIIPTPYHGITY